MPKSQLLGWVSASLCEKSRMEELDRSNSRHLDSKEFHPAVISIREPRAESEGGYLRGICMRVTGRSW